MSLHQFPYSDFKVEGLFLYSDSLRLKVYSLIQTLQSWRFVSLFRLFKAEGLFPYSDSSELKVYSLIQTLQSWRFVSLFRLFKLKVCSLIQTLQAEGLFPYSDSSKLKVCSLIQTLQSWRFVPLFRLFKAEGLSLKQEQWDWGEVTTDLWRARRWWDHFHHGAVLTADDAVKVHFGSGLLDRDVNHVCCQNLWSKLGSGTAAPAMLAV